MQLRSSREELRSHCEGFVEVDVGRVEDAGELVGEGQRVLRQMAE